MRRVLRRGERGRAEHAHRPVDWVMDRSTVHEPHRTCDPCSHWSHVRLRRVACESRVDRVLPRSGTSCSSYH